MRHKIDINHMLSFNQSNIEQLDDYRKARYSERFFSKQAVLDWFNNNNTSVIFDYHEEKIIEFINTLPEENVIVDFDFSFEMSDDPSKIFIHPEVRFQIVM